MATQNEGRALESPFEPEEQTPALVELFRSLNIVRKSLGLYGAEHSITVEHLAAFKAAITAFLSTTRRATCIFGKNTLIVNENSYLPSDESRELARRLKARGVMAITFAGAASDEEVLAFISFLNTDPNEIRVQGGPSTYLRRHCVTRIVATEAVYTSDDDEDAKPRDVSQPTDVDRAIASAIEWLAKQDEEQEDESPRLPITDILSHPGMAARLIHEAVSKLHASRRQYTDGELATEVIHDLKELAASDPEGWDGATPQIRKAMAKLPREMLPAASGFTNNDEDDVGASRAQRATASIDEVEATVAEALGGAALGEEHAGLPAPKRFDHLFGARANGLLSNWRRELQPVSVMRSSGRTLNTLMVWENSALEHGRVANAIAALMRRALEMNDIDSALDLAESLISEVRREDGLTWRTANAKSALQSVDIGVMTALVETAIQNGGRRAEEVSAGLVTTVDGLAPSLTSLLGVRDQEPFGQALRRGMVESRQAALAPLGSLLREGSHASRMAALELLVEISGSSAAREIATVLEGTDDVLAARALDMLPGIRVPVVVDICVGALSHRSVAVRCAAVRALGALEIDTAFEHVLHIANRRSLRGRDTPEKLAAVAALERSGRPEALECLEKMASRRPLIGRSRYEAVRTAAEHAAAGLRERLAHVRSEAA